MLKKCLLFSYLLSCFFVSAKETFISVNISETKATTVSLETPVNGTYIPNNAKDITLDNGKCDITIDIEKAGLVYLKIKKQTIQLYVKPGGNYGVAFNAKDYDKTLNVGGDDALTQQIINKAVKVSIFRATLKRQSSADGIFSTTENIRKTYHDFISNLSIETSAKEILKLDIDYFINYQTNQYFIELKEKVGDQNFQQEYQEQWNKLNAKVKMSNTNAAASKWYHQFFKQYVSIYKSERIAALNESAGLSSEDFKKGKQVSNILKVLGEDFKNDQYDYAKAVILAEYLDKYKLSANVKEEVQTYVNKNPKSPYAIYLKEKLNS